MTKLSDFAEHIYANNIDLSQPLMYEQVAKRAHQAAEIFFKYIDKIKLNNELDPQLRERLDVFIINREIIKAIQEVRNATGLGLKEAKDFIDRYRVSGNFTLDKK